MVLYDVVIVGGGAAGLTAALYSARQGLKTLVVTMDIGGQAVLTPHIENYPGVGVVSGLELAERLREQAESFGAEFIYDKAVKIEDTGENLLLIHTRGSGVYEALAVILAFGKTPRPLGVPGEERLVGKGVSYCAVCDAPLFRGRRVIVVGAGDPAVEAALLLCRYGNAVSIVQRGSSVVANEQLIGECVKNRVEVITSTVVKEIKGEAKVEAVVLQNIKTGEEQEVKVDGVFVEMGYAAQTDWVKDLVVLNNNGEIVTNKLAETSHPGIFAAGDVTDMPYKQFIISAGEGAVAALSAYNYIARLRGRPAVKTDWKALKKEESGFKLEL
ncbi:MAG TPA: FAD-dependent oxidoreductase [Candidatus Caldiarchaeum subterraneum]|uniref:FAD-dependent oxidoreductase n=1 Tax=Caldiarchaeum subterraneum TaxID=311458 RepID=A0A833E9D0_CALS0|nr:FAD-dependent oxidoreductase [Candidatus Caldarchaeum subterraneum]